MHTSTKLCLICGQPNETQARKCHACNTPLPEEGIIDKMEAAMIQVLQHAVEERYEILERIGRSGSSLILKARQKDGIQRTVALKVPRWLFPFEPKILKARIQRFNEEAHQLALLNHNGIVRLLDWDVIDQQLPYLVLQYLEGEDLRSVLHRRTEALPIETLRAWFLALAEALGYAHQKGVIHRDIKSANVMICSDGKPVLIDFGIARDQDMSALVKITQEGTLPGTWLYMSPEQARGVPIDKRSDVYSFGVVMYEALAGKLPFEGECWQELQAKTVSVPPEPLQKIRPEIPELLENVVLRSLMKEPSQRYQTCEELAQALRHGEPRRPQFRKGPLTKISLPASPLPRWKKIVFGLAGLIALAALFLVYQFFQPRTSSDLQRNAQIAPEDTAGHVMATAPRGIPQRDSSLPRPAPPAPKTNNNQLAEAIQKYGAKNYEAAWQICAQILRDAPNDQNALSLREQITQGWREEIEETARKQQFPKALERARKFGEYVDAQTGATHTAAIYEKWGDALSARRGYAAALKKYQQGLQALPKNTALLTKTQATTAALQKWLGLTLIFVEGGSFHMGDSLQDSKTLGKDNEDEQRVHFVRVDDFYVSAHEITFAQFDSFCTATGRALLSDNGWGRGERPAINVTWEEAKAFCDWLMKRVGEEVVIKLPTEAQWEYAARERGRVVRYAGTDELAALPEYAWFAANMTQPVGQKRANALGLFDMSGNVYEWCEDRYEKNYYKDSPTANPTGPNKGKDYVLRGGSALSAAVDLRCSNREHARSAPDFKKWKMPTGFRIVVTP